MSLSHQVIALYQKAQSQLIRWERRRLLKTFWLGVGVFFVQNAQSLQTNDPLVSLAAILVSIASLYPMYLWCSGKALGMPIFPFFALTHLNTNAIPLLSNHPLVVTYPPESQFYAGITVTIHLAVGSFFWLKQVKSSPPPPLSYRALVDNKGENFFLLILAGAVFFQMYARGKWFALSGGLFALVRGGILGLSVLAVFILSYRQGEKKLTGVQSQIYIVLMISYFISSAAGLVLRDNVGVFSVAFIAYILGSRRIPLITIVMLLACLTVLHYGKGEMRGKYWFDQGGFTLQPWQYPAWYSEWIGYSFENLNHEEQEEEGSKESSPSERSSIIQMLLLAQKKSPEEYPYLMGKTYLILPQMILPRIIYPNKPRSHEGTYILSVYYGLQSYQDTYRTTIAWGLLAEAYANFGLMGCTGLGMILGTAYGKISRWSMNTSILSVRSLFSILIISFAAQSEWSASVYVASLFQSSMVLVGISFVFMKVIPNRKNPVFELMEYSHYYEVEHE
ncbi:putative membrane protein [Lyngbya aestuarii BL J]|uniref:Putative membrane protein n=1 Tax=Lyngbya aestuarii BL J TaxID=1348334 RepID=U7QP33_9CYAN|nr:hypothetical protein [Lyngbya aestuarii]ERT08161.1 putative membrane protein [Lyngbya aestuarii BL J]